MILIQNFPRKPLELVLHIPVTHWILRMPLVVVDLFRHNLSRESFTVTLFATASGYIELRALSSTTVIFFRKSRILGSLNFFSLYVELSIFPSSNAIPTMYGRLWSAVSFVNGFHFSGSLPSMV